MAAHAFENPAFDNPGAQGPGEQGIEQLHATWAAAMRAGDFNAAWRVNDEVLAGRDPTGRDDAALPYHQRWVWDGRPFDGRHVLVRCYHGLGDTVQFSRYLPALRSRAGALTLEAPPALIPLLRLIGAADRILPFDPAAPAPASECDLEIMELSHALRAPPSPSPYLPIERRKADSFAVGVCWQVNAEWRPDRSVPVDLLTPLASLPGVRLQSLQQGAAFAGPARPCPDAILETARAIAGLDVVITVDTMVAHLAGAIGVPVWLLLGATPDWRWWAGGRGSPWYEGVTKYQQTVPGDWHEPVAAVIADLTRRVAAGTVRDRMGS